MKYHYCLMCKSFAVTDPYEANCQRCNQEMALATDFLWTLVMEPTPGDITDTLDTIPETTLEPGWETQ